VGPTRGSSMLKKSAKIDRLPLKSEYKEPVYIRGDRYGSDSGITRCCGGGNGTRMHH